MDENMITAENNKNEKNIKNHASTKSNTNISKTNSQQPKGNKPYFNK